MTHAQRHNMQATCPARCHMQRSLLHPSFTHMTPLILSLLHMTPPICRHTKHKLHSNITIMGAQFLACSGVLSALSACPATGTSGISWITTAGVIAAGPQGIRDCIWQGQGCEIRASKQLSDGCSPLSALRTLSLNSPSQGATTRISCMCNGPGMTSAGR